MGDFNHGHIQWNFLESTGSEDQQFLFLIQDSYLTQHVLEPTRGENVLYIGLSTQKELVDNVKILEPLGNSDHSQIHFDINVKSESKNRKTYKRNFHKGNYKDMRIYLAKLDWNNMLMHKTAIECWNILKYEIESIIDKFVPFQKQGKRCRKKQLSKEAIRKIVLRQTMWRVYRRTRKEEDYANYKEALNAANYRPVSLTSVICKLLERLIKDHMVDFLVKHKLLNSSQHGFLKARSCFTNMLCFLEAITKWIDVGSPVDIIYLDFQKAFDKMLHQRLLLKLKAHGIGDSITDWIEQWLTDRRQRVGDGEVSNWKSVLSGVPQGSVL